MTKAADAFRTISEVAEALNTPAHVLRFWESKFTQVKPVKLAGGRRYYRPSDIALLAGIKALLHERGLTIRGVQKILREDGVKHVAAQATTAAPALPEPGPVVGIVAPEPARPPRKPVIVRFPEAVPATAKPAAAPQEPAASAAAASLDDIAPMLFEALPQQHAQTAPAPQRATETPAAAAITLWSERLRRLTATADPDALLRLQSRAQALRNRLAEQARL
jgi:DNA-binding transcriptional MerR regulator